MSHKLVTFFLCLIIGLGFFIRITLTAHYPLWLDEQFSLLFSWSRTPFELLIQNRDVHPGLSYIFLKGLLVFTSNLFVLRLLLSVLPQLLGGVCVLWWARKQQWATSAVLFLAVTLFLDPFFVFTGIHLRMYGLVCLIASLTYIALKSFQQDRSKKYLLMVIALLLLGNAISYAFFFLTLGVVAWLVADDLKEKTFRHWPAIALSILSLGEFFLLAGFSVKRQFEEASWIPIPGFFNIPSLFFTLLGFETNYFLGPVSLSLATVLFYLAIAASLVLIFQKKKKPLFWTSSFDLGALVVLPCLLIVSISLVMPFLSQRFFFYQFLPRLSLFLPRLFTPILVMFFCTSAEVINRKIRERALPVFKVSVGLLLGLTSVFWVRSYVEIWKTTINLQRKEAQKIEFLKKEQVEVGETLESSNIILLPSWSWLTLLNTNNLDELPAIMSRSNESAQFESELVARPLISCSSLQQKKIIFLKNQTAYTVSSYYQNGERNIEHCCRKETENDAGSSWLCSNDVSTEPSSSQ